MGSTDFLGNPVGLIRDLSEGFSGFVTDGNVGTLIKNVTHGAANSAAKVRNLKTTDFTLTSFQVTGTLSAGLSKATLDQRYDEKRLMIRRKGALKSSSSPGSWTAAEVLQSRGADHLAAGFRGLGFGLWSGFTSVLSETYGGVTSQGASGFFPGLGKGIVGTFSKPGIARMGLSSAIR